MSGLASDEIAGDYKRALEELQDSSRQDINHLTLIAGESIEHAAAIARTLENHIKLVNPNRKLPALYLLDSIIKNVGTPYTLFFGSNLYSTFMNAYTLVNPFIRQKLDEMLGTWKMPNPGSSDPSPVLPPETTRPIEDALIKARLAAVEQQRRDALRAQQEYLARSRTQPHEMWSTPPAQNAYPPPSQQPYSYTAGNAAQIDRNPTPNQYSSAYPPPKQYTSPVDLSALHKDIGDLIWTTRSDVATNPHDVALQTRLKALLDLQNLLRQQYHPPDQLQQVRNQVTQLQLSARPLPATSTPEPTPIQTPSVDIQALLASGSLVNLLAGSNAARSATPIAPPAPIPPTPQNSDSGNTSHLLASLQARGLLNNNEPAKSSSPFVSGNDVELTSASVRKPRPGLISALYEALQNQCTTCGKRFGASAADRDAKRRHYDWHFRTHQRLNEALKRPLNRSWYVGELDWIRYRDDPEGNLVEDDEEYKPSLQAVDDPKLKYILVPSDAALLNQPCPICQEKFAASYNDSVADWVWNDAVQIGPRVYHASCHADLKQQQGSRDSTPLRGATPDTVLGKRKANEYVSPHLAKLAKA